jgi:hypothetical protein
LQVCRAIDLENVLIDVFLIACFSCTYTKLRTCANPLTSHFSIQCMPPLLPTGRPRATRYYKHASSFSSCKRHLSQLLIFANSRQGIMQEKQVQDAIGSESHPLCYFSLAIKYAHYAASMFYVGIYMLKGTQERNNDANAPRTGRTRRSMSIPKERTPKDFLVVVGVLVAVKSPVRTSVVVVTVTLDPPCAAGVAVEPRELQSEDTSYRMPLIITPSLLMIMFF